MQGLETPSDGQRHPLELLTPPRPPSRAARGPPARGESPLTTIKITAHWALLCVSGKTCPCKRFDHLYSRAPGGSIKHTSAFSWSLRCSTSTLKFNSLKQTSGPSVPEKPRVFPMAHALGNQCNGPRVKSGHRGFVGFLLGSQGPSPSCLQPKVRPLQLLLCFLNVSCCPRSKLCFFWWLHFIAPCLPSERFLFSMRCTCSTTQHGCDF